MVPEAVLWSYISQICSALKVIHNTGLACRVIDASKILITGKNRYLLNFLFLFYIFIYLFLSGYGLTEWEFLM